MTLKRLILVFLLVLPMVGLSQLTLHSNNAMFQTTNQSMWGPGSFNINTNFTIFEIPWNVNSGQFGSVGSLGGFQFGFEMIAGTNGLIGMYFVVEGFSLGDIDIDYPTIVSTAHPSLNSFNKGEKIGLAFQYAVDDTQDELATVFPQAGRIGLDLRVKMNFTLGAKVCFFGCTPMLYIIGPNAGFDHTLTLMGIDARNLSNITANYPCNDISQLYFCETTLANLSNPIEFDISNGLPLSGKIGIPHVQTNSWLNSDKSLQAYGRTDDSYLGVTMDIIGVLSKISEAIPPPPGPAMVIFFDALSNSIPLGPGGIATIDYTLFGASANADVYMSQRFKFTPTLQTGLKLPVPVQYEVYSKSGSLLSSAFSDSIVYSEEDSLAIDFPCNFDFIDVQPHYSVDQNNFTNNTYDSLQFTVAMEALSFGITIPQVEVLPQICFPTVYGGCPKWCKKWGVPYPCGWNSKCFVLIPAFCTPSIVFPGVNFSVGPLWQTSIPIGPAIIIPYFSGSWTMLGFNTVVGTPFKLDAKDFIAATTVSNVLCHGDSTGQLSVNITNGTPPYQVDLMGLQTINNVSGTNATFNGLQAGSYAVVVTDANGCNALSSGVVQEPVEPLHMDSIFLTNVDCNGNTSGAIQAFIGGGTPGYNYQYNGAGLNSMNQTFSNLPASTFSLQVLDSNSCAFDTILTITEPQPFTVSNSQLDVSCFNGNDGEASVTPSGGTLPYSFLWSTGDTTSLISGLTSGSYTVTSTDGNGCDVVSVFTITQPAAPLTFSASVSDALCFGDTTGAIQISANGGTSPYSYQWVNGAQILLSQTTASITNIPAETYFLTVTDGNGCQQSDSFLVSGPSLPLSGSLARIDVDCHSELTGSLSLSSSGGTPNYSYTWSDGATTPNLAAVGAGTYSVTVTDANGCTWNDSVAINEPQAPLSVQLQTTSVLCFGDSTGSIQAFTSGGTPGYTYQWSTGQASSSISNLPSGNYSLTVTDSNGCFTVANAAITQPTAPLQTVSTPTDILCYGELTGSVSTLTSGGTGSYNYQWANSSGILLSDTMPNILTKASGTYFLTVTDDAGCTFGDTFTLIQPNQPLQNTFTQLDVGCYGEATGEIKSTIVGGTAPYQFVWNTGSTADSLTGLTAAVYTLTITDANNCTLSDTLQISEPSAPLSLTASHLDVSCFGDSSGSILVSTSGGTGAYQWNWNTSATTESVNNLSAGVYSLSVIDDLGCVDSINVSITQPGAPLSNQLSKIDVACFGDSTGSIEQVISGGTSPYTYTWNTSNNLISTGVQSTWNNLRAGSYYFKVTDTLGCELRDTIVINQPQAPLANIASAVAVSCHQGTDGARQIVTSGGTVPYTYLWSDGATGSQATGLTSGMYTVTITDSLLCQYVDSVYLSEPAMPLSLIDSVTHVDCFGNQSGSIFIQTTGGTSPYSWQWGTGDTSASLTTLAAGSYNLTVTDANGCIETYTRTITEPLAPLTSIINTDSVLCHQGFDGGATVNVNGGTLPYQYSWNQGNGVLLADTLSAIQAKSAGVYTVNIVDANGCTLTDSAHIGEPQLPLSSSATVTDVLCHGLATGSAKFAVSGGTIPYNYSWNTGSTSDSVSNVLASTYFLTVADANGCTLVEQATIQEPSAPLSLQLTKDNNPCFNFSTGGVYSLVLGGTQPYQYTWSTADTNKDIHGLVAGVYTLTVTDAYGCAIIDSANVAQPAAPLSVQSVIQPVLCYGDSTGSIQNNTQGGTAPYLFEWGNSQQALLSAQTEDLSGLTSDTYYLKITDSQGCIIQDTFTVSQPGAPLNLTFSHTNVNCFGGSDGTASALVSGGTGPYIYLWSLGSTAPTAGSLSEGSYTVTVIDQNQCSEQDSLFISQPSDSLQIASELSHVSCLNGNDGSIDTRTWGGTPPYILNWNTGDTLADLVNLLANSYALTVTDQNGCIETHTAQINQPATAVSVSGTVINETCFESLDGSIQTAAVGGVGSYSFTWSNSTYKLSHEGALITNLGSDVYYVSVTDANGCVSTQSFVVDSPEPLSYLALTNDVRCFGDSTGTIEVTGQGGTFPIVYDWSTGEDTNYIEGLSDGAYTVTLTDANGCALVSDDILVAQPDELALLADISDATCLGNRDGQIEINVFGGVGFYRYFWSNGKQDALINELTAGTYNVQVSDANGCALADTFRVQEASIRCIEIPNTFTPNGDGLNDVWFFDHVELYPEINVRVYNKNGNLIFQSQGYSFPWDGTYGGIQLPSATYYYVVDPGPGEETLTGTVTLVR